MNTRDEFPNIDLNPSNPYLQEEMYICTLIKRFPKDIKSSNEKQIFNFFSNIIDDRETQAYIEAKNNSFLSRFSDPFAKFFETPTHFRITNTNMLLSELIVRDFLKKINTNIPLKEKKFRAKLIVMCCLEALLFNKKEEYLEILKKAKDIDPKEFKKQFMLAIYTMKAHSIAYAKEGNLKAESSNNDGALVLNELYKEWYDEDILGNMNYPNN